MRNIFLHRQEGFKSDILFCSLFTTGIQRSGQAAVSRTTGLPARQLLMLKNASDERYKNRRFPLLIQEICDG
jgi:hypothetical protein